MAVNYSGLSGNVTSDESAGEEENSGAKDPKESWQTPAPIVIPSRESENESGSVRGSRSIAVPEQQDETDAGEEQSETGSDSPISAENRNSNDIERSQPGNEPIKTEVKPEREPEVRAISVAVNNQFVEGVFDEPVSTRTHQEGDTFYLTVSADVYADGYKVIRAGANIRGAVRQVRDRGQSRRATLAVSFEEVQAIDGSWLQISYPEYSNQSTGSVTFEKGRSISRLRIDSGVVTLELE